MDELRLRTRTVSELVDAAFALYRRDAGQYILLMAVATLPQLVAQFLLTGNQSTGLSSALVALILVIVSTVTYTIGTAAVMAYGSKVYLGEHADLQQAVRGVMPKVVSILWAGFLKSLLYVLGFLLFFVGGLYVAARYFAVVATIVLEDASADEAFGRSSALSAGRKRHILNTLLLVWIIYFLLNFCVSLFTRGSQVASIAASGVFTIVAYPVVGLTIMVLYYDCRIRGEGFDIERMSASLGQAGGPAPGAAGVAI